MTKGIFVHRTDSIYDDSPAEQYQFPHQYLTRVSACVGDWIIYYEPIKIRDTRGYFAVAKVAHVVPDPTARDMYLALIEPGTYLDFPNPVPFNGPLGLVERGVLNEQGKISGRAQSAVRPLSIEDFNRIIDLGLADDDSFLPRIDEASDNMLHEERSPFQFEIERDRVANLGSRLIRDRLFRRRVVEAYDARCAVTGLKLINGGGRAEVEAAHIRPVDCGGPDIVTNGIALSGTVHWMFDRGLIGLNDDLEILVSRQANDPDSIRSLINRTGFAIPPQRPLERPHPAFVAWLASTASNTETNSRQNQQRCAMSDFSICLWLTTCARCHLAHGGVQVEGPEGVARCFDTPLILGLGRHRAIAVKPRR